MIYKSILNILYVLGTLVLTTRCGATKSSSSFVPTIAKAVDNASSVQQTNYVQPSPVAQPEQVPAQQHQVFIAPAPVITFASPVRIPFSNASFLPHFDVPCGGPIGTYALDPKEAWNHHCVNVAKPSRTEICQPLTDTCSSMEPLLKRSDADKRTKWAEKCFENFKEVIANMTIAAGTTNGRRDHCPLYPILGWVESDNKTTHVWTAPVDENASCAMPVNVIPILFCSTHLK